MNIDINDHTIHCMHCGNVGKPIIKAGFDDILNHQILKIHNSKKMDKINVPAQYRRFLFLDI